MITQSMGHGGRDTRGKGSTAKFFGFIFFSCSHFLTILWFVDIPS